MKSGGYAHKKRQYDQTSYRVARKKIEHTVYEERGTLGLLTK